MCNDPGAYPFPRLRVGTFIEALQTIDAREQTDHFPAFGWGLSLRLVLKDSMLSQNWISPPSGGDFH